MKSNYYDKIWYVWNAYNQKAAKEWIKKKYSAVNDDDDDNESM